jgi:glutamate-5-semialdehyde dehydrogenase
MSTELLGLAQAARKASRTMAKLDTNTKNGALQAMAAQLLARQSGILFANEQDLNQARLKGISAAMLDRLALTGDRLQAMATALVDVAHLPDPVGSMDDMRIRPNGLQVGRMRIPLGVIAIIYEARPNVTSDAAGLCLKSGNAVILRGGSEAFRSNQAIVDALRAGLDECGLDRAAITLAPTTDRQAMVELLKLESLIDLVIPRGGEGLIRFVAENSRIPVIKHYKGICHLYVDKDADQEVALRLLVDGKTSRPGVCNALETMLVHKAIAAQFLPKAAAVLKNKNVELRGCAETCALVPAAVAIGEGGYDTEYLDLILSVRVVGDYEEAVAHIEQHSSDHTEVIVTENLRTSRRFIRDVNSSSVMVNASSRFADGGELGLGAEIGISTTRLHAYGPMGLAALTTQKFVVIGEGQTRHQVIL